MCGRYSLATPPDQLADHFRAALPPNWQPSLNAAPSQSLPVLLEPGRFALLRWGCTPSWAKTRLINARAETLTEKPTFRAAFQARRCLVPADGFYEWQTLPNGAKQPIRFGLQDGAPFAFGGFWLQEGDSPPAFLIITTAPNALVAPVHNRMPVILPPERYAAWLDPAAPLAALQPALQAYPAEEMLSQPADPAALRRFV